MTQSQKSIRYISAETLSEDDFGDRITFEVGEVIWDAKTQMGPWATMTQKSFNMNAHKSVRENGPGTGRGQKYVRQSNGELHKVDG